MRYTAETAVVTQDLQMSEKSYLCGAMRTPHITEAATLNERLIDLKTLTKEELETAGNYLVSLTMIPERDYKLGKSSFPGRHWFPTVFHAIEAITGCKKLYDLHETHMGCDRLRFLGVQFPKGKGYKSIKYWDFINLLTDNQKRTLERWFVNSARYHDRLHFIKEKEGSWFVFVDGILGQPVQTLREAIEWRKSLGWFFEWYMLVVPCKRIRPYERDPQKYIGEVDYEKTAYYMDLR